MRKEKIINGIQQIGIGVRDAKKVFNWYRKYLGFDILVFEDVALANLMARYTDGVVHERYALLALNMIGGGGLEIWEFKSRTPNAPKMPILVGDLGINMMKVRTSNLEKARSVLIAHSSNSVYGNTNRSHFFFSDPWNNLVQVVKNDYHFSRTRSCTGGVLGVIIGVSDMTTALRFYQGLLGYGIRVTDRIGVFDDFLGLPGGNNKFHRILLQHPKRQIGGFGELYGPSEIELVQVLDRKPLKIYKDRFWGDLGYMHLCYDISGMDTLSNEAQATGYELTVDSANSFDMGDAAGRFGYIEDHDGTLIEFVETHKVPIFKKLGLYINLKKRNPIKPLPRWLVKMLRVHRVRKNL